MTPLRTLYPPIAAYRTSRLRVSAIHELHFEEYGNPDGKPVVCLHGGPGAGLNMQDARMFDPTAYRIVLFDQRGCGKSSPFASLEENTTWHLVADLEALRDALGIAQWMIFGGSWGSTLALAYAQMHPARVAELILRGVFLFRRDELDWFYRQGADRIYPDRWESFLAPILEHERTDLVRAYLTRLTSPDPKIRDAAAYAWCAWELGSCSLMIDDAFMNRVMSPESAPFRLALATLEAHYVAHGAWLEGRELLANMATIRGISCEIVQGRYDMVCPMTSAWDLHRAWPEAKFHLIEGAGHMASEPGIASALVEATNRYR